MPVRYSSFTPLQIASTPVRVSPTSLGSASSAGSNRVTNERSSGTKTVLFHLNRESTIGALQWARKLTAPSPAFTHKPTPRRWGSSTPHGRGATRRGVRRSQRRGPATATIPVSYTHLRAHETD